jgi:hypothetical protein
VAGSGIDIEGGMFTLLWECIVFAGSRVEVVSHRLPLSPVALNVRDVAAGKEIPTVECRLGQTQSCPGALECSQWRGWLAPLAFEGSERSERMARGAFERFSIEAGLALVD